MCGKGRLHGRGSIGRSAVRVMIMDRRTGNRTPVAGFGDRCSATELSPSTGDAQSPSTTGAAGVEPAPRAFQARARPPSCTPQILRVQCGKSKRGAAAVRHDRGGESRTRSLSVRSRALVQLSFTPHGEGGGLQWGSSERAHRRAGWRSVWRPDSTDEGARSFPPREFFPFATLGQRDRSSMSDPDAQPYRPDRLTDRLK